jgi:hypothetical protein
MCVSYENVIALSADNETKLENNLESFSNYLTETFETLNIVLSENINIENLHKLYEALKTKLDVDLSDVAKTSSAFYTFLGAGSAILGVISAIVTIVMVTTR